MIKRKMPLNYANSKVYKITGGGMTYIGSTTVGLSQRLAVHRYDYNNFKKGQKAFMTSYQLLEFDDCQITLIEDVPCERKDQLLMREREIMDRFECVNKLRPYVSDEEWKEHYIKYRVMNKVALAFKSKEYYESNKDTILLKTKEYREKNKEAIALRDKTNFTCECGSVGRIRKKSIHLKTLKHQSFLANSTNPEPTTVNISV